MSKKKCKERFQDPDDVYVEHLKEQNEVLSVENESLKAELLATRADNVELRKLTPYFNETHKESFHINDQGVTSE